MFDKLDNAHERYEELSRLLQSPDIASDNKQFAALMKEYKNLTPIMEEYDTYKKAKEHMEQAKELLDEGGLDQDIKHMAEAEIAENKRLLQESEERIKVLLLPQDPNDEKSVIVEIRGGAGGEEAMLFAASLYRMYTMYAESKRWKTEVLNENVTELGGYKEISFSLEGAGVYSKLKFESGVHRVQRVPETEAQGRVHTSTVTVAVLPEAEEV
jgi:peptide chain release factor 1